MAKNGLFSGFYGFLWDILSPIWLKLCNYVYFNINHGKIKTMARNGHRAKNLDVHSSLILSPILTYLGSKMTNLTV